MDAIASWLVRQITRLYPPRFRVRWGAALDADSRRALAEGSQVRVIQDAVGTLARAWIAELRAGRAERRRDLIDEIRLDVRSAFRSLRKRPGFSLVVVLTLALGLGVNATVLGIADALLLRPFQFRDYQRIVVLWETREGSSEREAVAAADFLDWKAQSSTVGEVGAWESWQTTLTGQDGPERLVGFRVTPGFFELFGITPGLGRTFGNNERQPGEDRSIIIGDGLWRRRFGADPAIVGRTVLLDDEPYTVVGVAPPRFTFPSGSELWAPLAFPPGRSADRTRGTLTVAGKLADGRSVVDAQAELDVISRRLEEMYPATNRGRRVAVRSLSTAFREDSALPVVGTLQAGAALLLVVACANLAGLLLARGLDRRRELMLRTALGASRMRIIRQVVTETVVLGLVAAALALVLAHAGIDVLRASMPADVSSFVEGWDNLRIDIRLIVLIPVIAIGVGLVMGLIPAIPGARAALNETLKDGDRGTAGGHRPQRARKALVVSEIAMTLALLVAASITLSGGMRLVNEPGGFDPERLLTMDILLPENRYGEPERRREFATALVSRLESLPAVERAALASILPASGWSPTAPLGVEHQPVPEDAMPPRIGYRIVSSGFFDTMDIPLVSGRTFSDVDGEDSQPVAIISATVARRFWPGEDPIGKRIRLEEPLTEWLLIVGVVGDVRMYNWWDGEDLAAVYQPLRQAPPSVLQTVVRTRVEPTSVGASLEEALHAVDSRLPVQRVRTMQEAIAAMSLGLTRMAVMIGLCGGIALLLSILAIYSTMSYSIAQRSAEFGVRLALGATGGDVLRLTLKQAVALTAAGIGVGVMLALALGRAMESALFGVVALDAMTFVLVIVALAGVSLAAAWFPARRALRVDPASVLRGQ